MSAVPDAFAQSAQSTQSAQDDQGLRPGDVVVPLIYAVRGGERPRIHISEQISAPSRSVGEFQPVPVLIRNGRLSESAFDLDREGFTLRWQPTATADLYDDDAVRKTYYPELERIVTAASGAASVLVFDHTRRAGAAAKERVTARDPVRRIHNDYTEESGPQRVRDLLDAATAARRMQRRFAIINIWRPIAGPVKEAPLAVCDARSAGIVDMVDTDQVYKDRVGKTYSVAASPRHRWYYFPDMQRDEVLLIKSYDSAQDGPARFTPHSAFDHPDTPADAPSRESIEARVLAFF